MSVENNSARSIDGLNTLFCDVINIVESIEIDGDNGNNNQLLTSDGTRTLWRDLSSLLAPLSVSTPLSFVAGSNYDGSVARTIEIPNLSIANDKLISSTISGVSLGGQLALLNVSSPLSYSSGSDYNGASTRTLQIADGAIGNAKLENSTISGKALGSNLENLHIGNGLLGLDLSDGSSTTEYNGSVNVGMAVNPKAGGGLTADGTGLYLTSDTISGTQLGNNLPNLLANAPLSFVIGAEYNGQHSRTLQIGNIPNSALQYSTISGINLGSNLESLDLYYGLEFLSGTTYNGGTARTLNLKAKVGGGISVDGTGAYLTNTTISGVSLGSDLNDLTAGNGLEMSSGTTYNGGTAKHIHMKIEQQTISDRVFYEDTGVGSERYIFVINSGDFRPNDDSSFYNISIDDDINKLTGRGRAMNTSLEAMAVLTIPQGWTPTGIFIDVRDSSGNAEPETLNVYKVRNWGGVNSASGPSVMLGSSTTNTERTFTGSYGASTSEYCLLVKVHLNSTIDYLGGGYVVLTAPTAGDDY